MHQLPGERAGIKCGKRPEELQGAQALRNQLYYDRYGHQHSVFYGGPGGHHLARIVSRIVLIPVIAGVSYEVLRLAGTSNSKIMDIISRPGMWMQGLTTKEPDDSMIQVAIAAVEEVFDWKKYLEENFPETYPAGYFEEQEKLA